jgi:hypothetical protein
LLKPIPESIFTFLLLASVYFLRFANMNGFVGKQVYLQVLPKPQQTIKEKNRGQEYHLEYTTSNMCQKKHTRNKTCLAEKDKEAEGAAR